MWKKIKLQSSSGYWPNIIHSHSSPQARPPRKSHGWINIFLKIQNPTQTQTIPVAGRVEWCAGVSFFCDYEKRVCFRCLLVVYLFLHTHAEYIRAIKLCELAISSPRDPGCLPRLPHSHSICRQTQMWNGFVLRERESGVERDNMFHCFI